MREPRRGPARNALAEFIVEVFRLNGMLLAEGDELTRDLGLTSARWQVLGALELEGRPLSVSQIARNMGLTRQSVQRIADELHQAALVSFQDNPDHRRAKLVVPTTKGHKAFRDAMRRQSEWAKHVVDSAGLSERRLRQAEDVLLSLRRSLTETKK